MSDRNEFNHTGDIDLVDFSANSEMQRIRENERIERERRMKRAYQLRRAEMIRRKKIEMIKQTILAWSILLLCVIAVVAVVIGIVSLFKNDGDTNEESNAVAVTEKESSLVADFSAFDGAVFSTKTAEENSPLSAMNEMYSSLADEFMMSNLDSPVGGSYLSMITDAYFWNATGENSEKIKQIVRDYPLYSNGYVWSSESSMRSEVVNSYLYDTNAAFVSAVCDICLWEGDTSFLESVDATGEANGDISVGMTVGEKLDKVVAHFFDNEDELNGGGVRYNKDDGLVYVLTADNNGTYAGKPSNLFYNHRFGYIDTYNNLAFNAAMQDLSALYTLAGDKENAEKYASVAKANKEAINQKLYDENKGRYVGCIDKEGEVHDAGFTVINLMAVSTGVADKEKAESILSWVEGKREITSDGLPTPNRNVSLAYPAFSTTPYDDWWFNANGNFSLDDEAKFGDYWMNGGGCSLAGNYYLLSAEDTQAVVYSLAKLFDDGKYFISETDKEPDIFTSLSVSNAVKELFDVTTDGRNLGVSSELLGDANAGLKNIAFYGRSYDVLFCDDTVYVMCDENGAVRLKIGGFDKNEMLTLATIENGLVAAEESVSADKNGVLSVSKKLGGTSYIRIEADKETDKKKK